MAGPNEEMNVELVDIDSLVLDPRNARHKHDIPALADSLRAFGQHRAAICQVSTRKVIAGNGMILAAQSLGWTTINVVWVEDDDEKSIRRGIADNATGDQSAWDDDVLRSLLDEVGIDIPGVTDKMIARLMKEEADEAEEPPIYPLIAQPGERYSYMLVVAMTEIDEVWMKSNFGFRTEQDHKAGKKIGTCRTLTIDRFQGLLEEMVERQVRTRLAEREEI